MCKYGNVVFTNRSRVAIGLSTTGLPTSMWIYEFYVNYVVKQKIQQIKSYST
jgi:hypothetical protein